MLIIRCSVWASSELDHCTAHSPPAAPTPPLLSIHSALAKSLLGRDQRHLKWANNEQERLLYTEPLCPSSLENSGCVKILAFVDMWFLSHIIFLWLSGVSGGRRPAILNLQCGHWLLYRFPALVSATERNRLAVEVWMTNVPLRLKYLKPWSWARGRLDGGSTSRGGIGFDGSKSYPTSSLSSASCWFLQIHTSQLPMSVLTLITSFHPSLPGRACVSLWNQRPNKLFLLLSAFGHDVSSLQQKVYWYTCFCSRMSTHLFSKCFTNTHVQIVLRSWWSDMIPCNPSLWKAEAWIYGKFAKLFFLAKK